jgi:hypothetical protein
MRELFTLGDLYVSDFIKNDESPRGERTEMKLMLTDDGNVRLEKSAPLDTMYGKYWYRSGINNSMKQELKNIVDSILKVKTLKSPVTMGLSLLLSLRESSRLELIP